MFEVLIIIGIALILGVIFLIFRITNLVGLVKKDTEKRDTASNRLNGNLFGVFLVLFFGLMFWYSYAEFDTYVLPVASEHGVDIDTIFWITMGVTGFVFIITHILLFLFPVKYKFNEQRKASFYPENNKLEILWTAVPAVVLTLLVGSGLWVWNDITRPAPEDSEVLEIMGYQFAWKSRYPGKDGNLGEHDYRLIDATNEFGLDFTDRAAFDDFVPREIHIPKGKPILFKIRARDVLHSVYAPHFRLKMDAVPGMPTSFHFVANKTTAEMRDQLDNPEFNYEIACTEICGRGHFSMKILVVVDEPEEYEKWYAEQQTWVEQNSDYINDLASNSNEIRDLYLASKKTTASTTE